MANYWGQLFRKTSTFEIRVKHWTMPTTQYSGGNGWNLYAIIKRGHPLFADLLRVKVLQEDYMDSELLCKMPFHGGVTLFEKDESAKGIVIGCDYLHAFDMDRSMRADTLEEAIEVREDADRLFKFFVQSLREGKMKELWSTTSYKTLN